MSKRAGWRWFSYAPEDAKAAQAELNRLAAEGLELEDVWFCAAKFKRTEGRAPACWVEPARWTGSRPRDEEKRGEYLALCREAGWTLVDQSRGMFWLKAGPGADPAPIQTDGGVEWEEVWRRLLASRVWQLLYVGAYSLLCTALSLRQGSGHFWTVFFSDSTVAALGALLCVLLLFLWQGFRALRYRGACRRAIGAGEALPVPGRRSAKARGAHWVVQAALLCAVALAWLVGAGERPRPDLDGELASWRYASSFAVHTEYHDWSEDTFLSIDDYDCRYGWLAGWIVSDLVSDEGDQRYLDRRYTHAHAAVEPERAALGFDAAWTYRLGPDRTGLIVRQGDRVVRVEAAAELTAPAALKALRTWLAEPG